MIHEYPLTKPNRLKIANVFRHVPRVDLSIDCLVEGQMGKILVDDVDNPVVFKATTGPFVYLAGDPSQPAALELLADLSPYTLLMPSAPGWLELAQSIYGDQLHETDRYSFSPERLSINNLQQILAQSQFREEIKLMDRAGAASVWGGQHFVDLSEFDSPNDFLQRGVAYYVEKYDSLIGAAYSSLACSKGIEISIFVQVAYRRQGLATALACKILTWCLERNLEPHWDAANLESSWMAVKLGYKPTGSYSAYFLTEEANRIIT